MLLLSELLTSSFGTASAASNTSLLASLPPKTSASLAQLEPRNAVVAGPVKVQGSDFVDANGRRFFLSGVNYEGHTDRAWAMWNDDKFDLNLINKNLKTAADGGINSIRIFIQVALRDEILSGRWYKLDKVIEIAAQNHLQVLITLADYDEWDLNKLIQVDSAIAAHFAGSKTVLGYDLKNEPQFQHIAGMRYPEGQTPPLQTDALIQAYGEKINQHDSDSWRNSNVGKQVIPAWLSSKQAYIAANGWKLFENFVDEGSKWADGHKSTFIDWLKSSDSVYWQPFANILNDSLNVWIKVQQDAIQAADPDKPTTIGFNHPYLAYLKANQSLGFISLHRFAPEGANSIASTLAILDQLKAQHSGKPAVLEEFGYTNSHGAGKDVSLSLTANYEAGVWLFLYSRGYAGGFKWMLTNYPQGFNPEENNYGLLNDLSQPKPAYYVTRAIHNYIAANPNPSGDFVLLESRDGQDVTYLWAAGDTIFSNLKDYTNNRIDLHQQDSVGWQVWWPGNSPNKLIFSGASKGRVTFDLNKFFPSWNANVAPTLSGDSGQNLGLDRQGGIVSFAIEPGQNYTLSVPMTPPAFQRSDPILNPQTVYFRETGHNLGGVFKKYWDEHGGLWLYGFPISEEFQEGGYTVQYFERNRFEYHPENKGTKYEVLLGLLGNDLTVGRKEAGEAPFQPIAASAAGAGRDWYKETGHSLGGVFRTYWSKYGGLAQFGFPLTEEFSEVNPADGKTYVVQYFERARFEYHPDFKGTPNEVLLGLLGNQVVKLKGWVN